MQVQLEKTKKFLGPATHWRGALEWVIPYEEPTSQITAILNRERKSLLPKLPNMWYFVAATTGNSSPKLVNLAPFTNLLCQ